MIAATVAHVACGALVLATAVVLAIQIHRHAHGPQAAMQGADTAGQKKFSVRAVGA
jgi:hypothetical protein